MSRADFLRMVCTDNGLRRTSGLPLPADSSSFRRPPCNLVLGAGQLSLRVTLPWVEISV